MKELKEFIEEDRIKPIIDKVYTLQDTGQAFHYLESGRAKGKVIIKVKKIKEK